MPGVKAQRAASRIEHSDSEDDFATSDRENGNPPTPEKGPIINRNKVSKVTKARAPTKTATAKKATAKTKAQREALKDRTNLRDDSEIEEEVEEAEDMDAAKPKAKKSRAKPQADVEAPAKKPRAQKTKKAPLSVIPETQQNAMEDVSQSIEVVDDENMDIDQAPSPQPKQRFVQRARSVSQQRQAQPQGIPPRARSTSQQPPQRGYSRGRSASDTERRMPDSEMKRKLAEMTQKYEDLQLKYENLQELGRNSAETNFDKLKRASDQRAKGTSGGRDDTKYMLTCNCRRERTYSFSQEGACRATQELIHEQRRQHTPSNTNLTPEGGERETHRREQNPADIGIRVDTRDQSIDRKTRCGKESSHERRPTGSG